LNAETSFPLTSVSFVQCPTYRRCPIKICWMGNE
jgi:hypothetical protein